MKETITRLIDDITKEPVDDGGGESIRFSVNGTEYEIDLNAKNAKKFHDVMKPYIDNAAEVEEEPPPVPTTIRRRASSAATKATKADKEQLQAMRVWLRENGHEVSDRGRVAQSLQDIYNAAHK